MNKHKLNRLSKMVKKYEERAAFLQEFLPITISERENKVKNKLEEKQAVNKEKLKKLAINAGLKLDYIQEEKQNLLDKIEKKYYLKHRVLTQIKKRKLSRSSNKSLVEEEFVNKEKDLLERKSIEIEAINKKYEKSPNFIEFTKQYDEAKKILDNNYSILEKALNTRLNLRNEKTSKNINARITHIKNVIDNTKKIVNSAKSEIKELNYGLEKDTLLKLENLTMRFGGLVAVNDLNFEVKKGEIFGLIGPNGAGKTTIFNCITRFYRPTAGKMYFRQNDFEVMKLNDYKVHDIVKLGISRTFQNVELIWELSILDNLLVAAHTKYQTGFFGQLIHSRSLAREERVFRKKALDILKLMDLLPYQNALPIGLPYGILKRIELARTLMINPKMIILDEPAAGLNEQETKSLSDTIKKIRDDYNTTIFLVEHDMGLVMDVCDTVCALSFGKKLAIGTPKEIQENKSVREAYLGEEQ